MDAYNPDMRVWSVRLGRVFGVEIRLHAFFLLLSLLFAGWASFAGRPVSRGLALCGLLIFCVLVREAARALTAAWLGLSVRSLLLLPTGGLLTLGEDAPRSAPSPNADRAMRLAGPLASIICGLGCAGLVLAVAPENNLLARPWVSPEHLLRALVWMNLLLGVVNLLPAWPLDGGQHLQAQAAADATKAGSLPNNSSSNLRASLPSALAILLVVAGLLSMNWWLIAAGITILLGAQVERQGLGGLKTGADDVKVADVMLTEYSILSASATLEDAAGFSRHTLQDVFPVVRAGNLVGAVSRGDVMAALERDGNGYVQGIMTRSFQTAAPADLVRETLNRISAATGSSAQLVPVLDGDQVVGILTPGNLQRAMGLVAMSLRAEQRRTAEGEKD